jgi:hypothetical protein
VRRIKTALGVPLVNGGGSGSQMKTQAVAVSDLR